MPSLALSNRRAGTTLRKVAIHRDHQDRRRSPLFHVIRPRPNRFSLPPVAPDMDNSGGSSPKITGLCFAMHRIVVGNLRSPPLSPVLARGFPAIRGALAA